VNPTYVGFNYKIDALGATDDTEPDELAEAFEALFAAGTEFSPMRFLQLRFPILQRFVNNSHSTSNNADDWRRGTSK
jgi:hypothetical protein